MNNEPYKCYKQNKLTKFLIQFIFQHIEFIDLIPFSRKIDYGNSCWPTYLDSDYQFLYATIGSFVAQSVCIEATIVGLLVRFPPQAMSLHKEEILLQTISNISQ
jgi:hypothetical protein